MSLGKTALLSDIELDTEGSPMAAPLAALGLFDSSTLCLCRLLSLLLPPSSLCPVEIFNERKLKSDRLL